MRKDIYPLFSFILWMKIFSGHTYLKEINLSISFAKKMTAFLFSLFLRIIFQEF